MCSGGLTADPTPAAPAIVKKTGCFVGPAAGTPVNSSNKGKYRTVKTIKGNSWCKIKSIESCNQKKLSNGPIWCKATTHFHNCPSMTARSGECKSDSKVGQCVNANVTGDITEIWMYDGAYKGDASYKMPSGFYLKFSTSGWTPLFGSKGLNTPKKWTAAANVVEGRAQFQGFTYDGNGQADFL